MQNFTTRLRTEVLSNTQANIKTKKADALANIKLEIHNEIAKQVALGKTQQDLEKQLELISFIVELVQDTMNHRGFSGLTHKQLEMYKKIEQDPSLKDFVNAMTTHVELLAAHQNLYFGDPNTKYRLITGKVNCTNSITQLIKYIKNIDIRAIKLFGTADIHVETKLSQINKKWHIEAIEHKSFKIAKFDFNEFDKNNFQNAWQSFLHYITHNSNINDIQIAYGDQYKLFTNKMLSQLDQALKKNLSIKSLDVTGCYMPDRIYKKLGLFRKTIENTINYLCVKDDIDLLKFKNNINLQRFKNEVSRDFYRRKHIKKLNLSNCELTSIPTNILKLFPKLEELNLSNNKIKIVKANVFVNLNYLYMLDISHNHIRIVENNAFVYLKNLNTLNLNHNKIIDIMADTFTELNNLKELYLNNNQITIK